MNFMDETQLFTDYYLEQADQFGHGANGIYTGLPWGMQRGFGIGSFLGGLFRSVLPLIRKTGSAVGRELVKSAPTILSDIRKNQNVADSLKSHAKLVATNAGRNLFSDKKGSGFINAATALAQQSAQRRRKRKTSVPIKRKVKKARTASKKKKRVSKGKKTNIKAQLSSYF